MSKLTETAPEHIFLQVSDLQRGGAGVTLCDESMVCCEVEYVRADIIDSLRKDAAELQAARRTLTSLGYTYHGGTAWKPPLGPVPDFEYLADAIAASKVEK